MVFLPSRLTLPTPNRFFSTYVRARAPGVMIMYGGRGALIGGSQAIYGDMWKYEPIASVWTPIVSASAEQPVGRYIEWHTMILIGGLLETVND